MIRETSNKFFKKDFWTNENLRYLQPHFRLQKCAKIINSLARDRKCELLDLGCGPAALAQLLHKNIQYFGIDIAIHNPRPNLLEMDFVENRIAFGSASFDIIVASGVFEYVGNAQRRKFGEIHKLLNKNGTFIVSYINFSHIHRVISPLYNNIQPIEDFQAALQSFFHVKRSFPVSHNWQGTPPRRAFLKNLEMYFDIDVPVVSHLLAVEYFFICSPKEGAVEEAI